VIQALAEEYPVSSLCAALEMASSAYYYQAQESRDEAQLKTYIQSIAGRWPTYGYRRITVQLQRDYQITVNSKRVRRLMQELGLQGTRPQRKKRTTNSDHAFPRYPNLVQGLTLDRPDQVWVGDITYIHLADDFVYLAVLMGVFTRSIRGWQLGRRLVKIGQMMANTCAHFCSPLP
jgi:transposase InsO family protein